MNDQTIDMRHMSRECPECGQRFSADGVFCPFDGTRLDRMSTSLSIDPLVGATIDGRYEVIELLGEGGMGRVYSVLHSSLGRLFALKALRRELARDEELSQRFAREARAMAAVRHPHIVEITDFGRLPDGVPYFVMEMLVGETLARAKSSRTNGCVPVARGGAILEQVASALAAAHEAGVVHRDLKPENVFLMLEAPPGREGVDDVRVVDFGAAKIIGASQVTRNGVVFGTPVLHVAGAGERLAGGPADGHLFVRHHHVRDVHGQGAVRGRHVHERPHAAHVRRARAPEGGRSLSGAALGALDQVTLVCLAKNPDKRFGSMHEVLAALKAAGEERRARRSRSIWLLGRARGQPAAGERRVRIPGPPSMKARAAEPRRTSDERSRRDALPPPPVPWGWIAVAAIGIGSALAALVWAYMRKPSAEPVPEPAPGYHDRHSGEQRSRRAPTPSSPATTSSVAPVIPEPSVALAPVRPIPPVLLPPTCTRALPTSSRQLVRPASSSASPRRAHRR